MSHFYLMEIEEDPSPPFVDYNSLDLNRDTVYRVYEVTSDQYKNETHTLLLQANNLEYARRYYRSCCLTQGIILEKQNEA